MLNNDNRYGSYLEILMWLNETIIGTIRSLQVKTIRSLHFLSETYPLVNRILTLIPSLISRWKSVLSRWTSTWEGLESRDKVWISISTYRMRMTTIQSSCQVRNLQILPISQTILFRFLYLDNERYAKTLPIGWCYQHHWLLAYPAPLQQDPAFVAPFGFKRLGQTLSPKVSE